MWIQRVTPHSTHSFMNWSLKATLMDVHVWLRIMPEPPPMIGWYLCLPLQVYLAALTWTPASSPHPNPSPTATLVTTATAQVTPTPPPHSRWKPSRIHRRTAVRAHLPPPAFPRWPLLRLRPLSHTQRPLIGLPLWHRWAPLGRAAPPLRPTQVSGVSRKDGSSRGLWETYAAFKRPE